MYTMQVWLCLYELGPTSRADMYNLQKPVICTLYTVQVWLCLYELGPTSRADMYKNRLYVYYTGLAVSV